MKTIKYFTLLLTTLVLISCNNTPKQEAQEINEMKYENTRLARDADVLTSYASNTLLSIEMARIAKDQSNNSEVKALASEMLEDHKKLFGMLITEAANYDIILPENLSENQIEKVEDFKGLDGTAFNTYYLNSVTNYHETLEDGMESMLKQTKYESLLDFGRMVDSQIFVHENRAKSLLEEMES